MFRVVKIDLLLRYIALSTVALSMGIHTLIQTAWFPGFSLFKVITISSIVIAVLVFLLLSPFFSRKIWAAIGRFDKSLFPDLNGSWEGEVTMEGGNTLTVRAVIRQSLVATQIDMHGETAKSVTLETTPMIEQGQKKLYYVYRATPKNPCWPPYTGTTIFDIRQVTAGNEGFLELSGYYYTDRKSIGRVKLRQLCTDSSKDVSFY